MAKTEPIGYPKLYLYMARRDKKGLKILSEFPFQECSPRRVQNISELNVSPNLEMKIKQTLREYGLKWELWIESANSHHDFCKALAKRKYRNIPAVSSPMHYEPPRKVGKPGDRKKEEGKQSPALDGNQQKKMIRKKRRV